MDWFYIDSYGFLGNPAVRIFIQRLIKLVDRILGLAK